MIVTLKDNAIEGDGDDALAHFSQSGDGALGVALHRRPGLAFVRTAIDRAAQSGHQQSTVA